MPAAVRLLEPSETLENPGAQLFADARKPNLYEKSRLPGAVCLFKGLFTHDPNEIAAQLGKLGASRDSRIVLYDDGSGLSVGPALWTLDRVGHPNTAVLNGGIDAWNAQGGTLETGAPSVQPTEYVYEGGLAYDNLADKAWVMASLEDDGSALLDSRSEPEFTGEKKEAARGGHIPGAVHFDWTETVATDDRKITRFLPKELLQAKLNAKNLTGDKKIACYCQIGIRSAQTYAVLRMLGYPNALNYEASWAEWGNDPNAPIETPE